MQTENIADLVIKAFGGITEMSKALGHKYPSTVSGWKQRGCIPVRHLREILRIARELNINIKPEDLF